MENKKSIFISYRGHDADVAMEFYHALRAADFHVFMAGESIRLGEDWSKRIDVELERCFFFLLLLTEAAATSEMVTEEVRRAKELRESRSQNRPLILPVRVRFPLSKALNYDLRGYLNKIQMGLWESSADTEKIVKEICGFFEAKTHTQRRADETQDEETQNEETRDPTQPEAAPDTNGPPLPAAPPELPGGQMDVASVYYIERPPCEVLCYETILKPGSLIRIKAPRQMGKTSLMSRVLQKAEESSYKTVPISFQIADGKVFADLDKLLRWFCAIVSRRLRLPTEKLDEYWDEIFGSKDNCTAYFEECVLANLEHPLVLALDEVDRIFSHGEQAEEFLGLLRAWHEEGKVNPLWKKLRLIVVHSTEVYVPMNINQSPFNVGLPIDLPEFNADQAFELARRHGLNWNQGHVAPLMALLGGHPYMLRLALYHIAHHNMTVEQLLAEAHTEAGIYGDHLRRHLWNIENDPEIQDAVKSMVAASGPVRLASALAFRLHSMGVARLEGNDCVPRCDLYRIYFRDRLKVMR